jgi:hypothetical protein
LYRGSRREVVLEELCKDSRLGEVKEGFFNFKANSLSP